MDNWHTVVLHLMTYGFIFFLGATIGSFLNVVVYRLPAGLNLVKPASRCPVCEHPIRAYDNVPVFGWCWLKGRCRDCGVWIPIRYPLVEFTVGVLFTILAAFELMRNGENLPGTLLQFGYFDPVNWLSNPQLLGIFVYHCALISFLVPIALLHFDGKGIPSGLAKTALVFGILPPLVFPDLRPVHFGEPFWSIPLPMPVVALVDGLLGLALGSWLGHWLSRKLDHRPDHEILAWGALGTFVGWQPMFAIAIWFPLLSVVGGNPRRHAIAFGIPTLLYLHLLFWRPLWNLAILPGTNPHLAFNLGALFLLVGAYLLTVRNPNSAPAEVIPN